MYSILCAMYTIYYTAYNMYLCNIVFDKLLQNVFSVAYHAQCTYCIVGSKKFKIENEMMDEAYLAQLW